MTDATVISSIGAALTAAPWPVFLMAGAACAGVLALARLTRLDRMFLPIPSSVEPEAIMDRLVRAAETAKRDGLLAVTRDPELARTPIVARGLHLIVQEAEPSLIRAAMEAEFARATARGARGRDWLLAACRTAPLTGVLAALAAGAIMLGSPEPWRLGATEAAVVFGGIVTLVLGLTAAGAAARRLSDRNAAEVFATTVTIEGLVALREGLDGPQTAARLRRLLPLPAAGTDAPLAPQIARAA